MSSTPLCVRQQVSDLVERLTTAGSSKDCLGTLKDLCALTVDNVSPQEMEDLIFSKVISPVEMHFKEMLSCISKALQSSKDDTCIQVLNIIEEALTLLECVDSLAKAVASIETIPLDRVRSLFPQLLSLTCTSYSHLKDMEVTYGAYFAQAEEQLIKVSDRTVQLQATLFDTLQRVQINHNEEDDVIWLVQVCGALRKLGCIVTDMELKMLVTVRKLLVRLMLQYCTALKNRLKVDEILHDLCSYVMTWILKVRDGERMSVRSFETFSTVGHLRTAPYVCKRNFQETDFSLELRVVAFHLKLVVSLLEKYRECYNAAAESLLLMVMHVAGLPVTVARCSNLNEEQRKDILQSLWIAAERLTGPLLSNELYCLAIMKLDISPDDWGRYVLLLVALVEKLGGLEDLLDSHVSASSEENILSRVFSAMGKCEQDLQLPVRFPMPASDENNSREVGFFEYVCGRICSFIANFPARHFEALELLLLRNVSHSNYAQAFLASEVWSFLARCCSEEVCFEHARVLARLTSHTTGRSQENVKRLLKRLVSFLGEEHKKRLSSLFPDSEHLPALGIPPSPQRVEEIWRRTLQLLSKLQAKNIQALELKELVALFPQAKACVAIRKKPFPLRPLLRVLGLVPVFDSPECCHLLKGLVALITSQINYSSNTDLLEILSNLENLFQKEVDFAQTLVVLSLSEWSSITIKPGPEREQVLHKLSQLFAQALSSENCIVQQMAMHVFAEFAQTTVHDVVISKAIECPALKQHVMGFLTKDELKKQLDWPHLLREQNSLTSERTSTTEPEFLSEDQGMLEDICNSPSRKRTKYYDDLDNTVDELRHQASRLQRQSKDFLRERKAALLEVYEELGALLQTL